MAVMEEVAKALRRLCTRLGGSFREKSPYFYSCIVKRDELSRREWEDVARTVYDLLQRMGKTMREKVVSFEIANFEPGEEEYMEPGRTYWRILTGKGLSITFHKRLERPPALPRQTDKKYVPGFGQIRVSVEGFHAEGEVEIPYAHIEEGKLEPEDIVNAIEIAKGRLLEAVYDTKWRRYP